MNHFRKLKQTFDNYSLKYKLFFILLCNGTLVFLISLLGLQLSSRAYNEQLFRAVSGNLSFSSQTIANTLKNVETMSSIAISSDTLQDALSRIAGSRDAIVWSNSNRELNQAIANYQAAYKKDGVSGIVLYNSRFRNTSNFSAFNKLDPFFLEQALSDTRSREGAVSWTIDHQSEYAILGRNVRKILNLNLAQLGDLLILVDFDQIVSDANRAVTAYDNSSYIVYDENGLLYASDDLETEMVEAFGQGMEQDTYRIVPWKGHSYFAVTSHIPHYEWTYISLIPYDQIASSLRSSHYLIAAILAGGLLLTLFITRWMTRYVLQDFSLLTDKMELFSNGLETPPLEDIYLQRQDEISRLHQHFNTMASRIQELIRKNYISEILRRDASLAALESQINPHFLYNTLESINWRAKASNDQTISMMTESLGALLRATLSNKSSLVTLGYELELVHSYITIQTFRFDERLDYTQQVPEEFLHCLLPPLTLQPLVENAIYYGLEESVETCYISIHAKAIPENDDNPSRLEIAVTNSGSHFDDNLLTLLKQGIRTPKRSGIGLLNIDQRIKLLFGDAYGITLSNQDDTAIVTITIPYKTGDETTC